MKHLLIAITSIFLLYTKLFAQEGQVTFGVLPTTIPTHNLLQYNRFYFNPTFSFVRENKTSIHAYSRQQWSGFNDNPQIYLVSFASGIREQMGVGLGLFQQNEGVYSYFGGIANYAYNAVLDRDMNLTFGLNLGFSQSGLKTNIDEATSTLTSTGITINDPVISNYQNSSVVVVSPGINFNYSEFDAGIAANNLAAYNLSASSFNTENTKITAHIMYTNFLQRRSNNALAVMAYAQMLNMLNDSETDLRYGLNALLNLPKYGWLQGGYNSFYGASIGLGGNINSNVSVGYTFEIGLGDTGDFGSSHEVGFAYNFAQETKKRSKRSNSEKALQERDSEIRRLKKEILEQDKIIRSLRPEGDTLVDSRSSMSKLERSIVDTQVKESNKIKELNQKRKREVLLLNAKKGQDLSTTKTLEQEAVTEAARLAAERKLAKEQNIADVDVADIAQQEAEREAVASKQVIEEEKEKRKDIFTTSKSLIATGSIEDLKSQKKIINESSILSPEQQEELANQIDQAIAVKEAEKIAAQKSQKSQQLLQATKNLIAEGNIERLQSQKRLLSENSFISPEEKQKLQQQIDQAIAAKKAEKQAAAQKQKSDQLLQATKNLIAEGNIERLQSQKRLLSESRFISPEEKQKLQQQIDQAIAAKKAEKQAAAQKQKSDQLLQATKNLIAEGNIERLRSQKRLLSESSFISPEQKQKLLDQINETIAKKEAQDAKRLAEIQKQKEEKEAAKLLTATQKLIAEGSIQDLRTQRKLIDESRVISPDQKNQILDQINQAIRVQEKEKEANQKKAQQILTATSRLLTEGNIEDLRRQKKLIAESKVLSAEQKQSLLDQLDQAVIAKGKEKEAKRQLLLRATNRLIAEGSIEELKKQRQVVSQSESIDTSQKTKLEQQIDQAIAKKTQELAKIAKETKRKEAARKAEVARKKRDFVQTISSIISNGTLEQQRQQLPIIRENELLSQAEKTDWINKVQAAISSKEAQIAEQKRKAEQARLAEEARKAKLALQKNALLAETQKIIQSGTLENQKKQQKVIADTNLLDKKEKKDWNDQLTSAIEEKEKSDDGLQAIEKELSDNSRITNRLFKRRDSLLTTSLNVDKREFKKLLESLVTMTDDAQKVKTSPNPSSKKRLSAQNRFVKFADKSRPDPQFATKYIPGYPEGYYLIGNVFKGGVYAERFTEKLGELGFENAQVIVNPSNQFQYVAIEGYRSKDQVSENYFNNVGNRYYGDMWILQIAKNRVESLKKLVQETRMIKENVKDDTVVTENLSFLTGHNIENGYYLVSNVFKRDNYFQRGMDRLKAKGLNPKYFKNPKDDYLYVYLERFDTIDEAKQSLFSNVNGTYDGDLYILKVE